MRGERLIGLLVAVVVAIWALGAVVQLGTDLFDHGGALPTLGLVVGFVLVVAWFGVQGAGRLSNAYW